MLIEFTDVVTGEVVSVALVWDGNPYVGPSVHANECWWKGEKLIRVVLGDGKNHFTRELSIKQETK